jgi:hypothetical protein
VSDPDPSVPAANRSVDPVADLRRSLHDVEQLAVRLDDLHLLDRLRRLRRLLEVVEQERPTARVPRQPAAHDGWSEPEPRSPSSATAQPAVPVHSAASDGPGERWTSEDRRCAARTLP